MKINLSIKFGIIAGIINCAAWFGFAKKLGFYTVEVYLYRNFVSLAVLVIGVFLTVYLTRKKNAGFLEFKKAMQAGIVYSLTLAVVLAIFNYVYYTFITPDTIEYFLSEAKKAAIAHNVKESDIPKFLDGERSNFSSFKLVPPVLFFGLISSLLAGAIFSKKNPHSFSAN